MHEQTVNGLWSNNSLINKLPLPRVNHYLYSCYYWYGLIVNSVVKGYILMVPLSLPMATSDCITSYANAVGWWGNPWLNTCSGDINDNVLYIIIIKL